MAQIVVLVPVLLLLVLLGVQAAIFFHAANVASAAASQGAVAGAPLGSGAGPAEAAARQTLSELGAASSSAAATESAEFVTVTVEVAFSHLVPFFPDTVQRTAVQPRERFVPESDR